MIAAIMTLLHAILIMCLATVGVFFACWGLFFVINGDLGRAATSICFACVCCLSLGLIRVHLFGGARR